MGQYARRLQQRFSNSVVVGMKGKPIKPNGEPADKGQYMGSCNRSHCLRPGANWYNHGSLKYYCADCAYELSNDSFNKAQAVRDWGPGMQLCEFQPTAEPLPRRQWL